jgi:hypothetical protein
MPLSPNEFTFRYILGHPRAWPARGGDVADAIRPALGAEARA